MSLHARQQLSAGGASDQASTPSQTPASGQTSIPSQDPAVQTGPVTIPEGQVPAPLATTTLLLINSTQTATGSETYRGLLLGVSTANTTVSGTVQFQPDQVVLVNSTTSGQTASSTALATTGLDTVTGVGATSSQSTMTSTGTSSASQDAKKSPGAKSGAAPGTVAGAAIGAAIGAGILAFLIAFWMFRRKRRPVGAAGAVYFDEKSPPSQHPWEVYMPQSADDGTIRSAVESLYSQIDLHVENFYGNVAGKSITIESEASLRQVDAGILPRPVEEMMSDSGTPVPVIKHCFAWMIMSRLSPTADGKHSLLPSGFARLPTSQGLSKSRHEREEKAMSQAYSYWRVLTAQLLYPKGRGLVFDAAGKSEVVETLTTAFAPWSSTTKGNGSAEEHLESVLKTATTTGLLIASQSSTFAFKWNVRDREADSAEDASVITCPKFGKTADEFGNVLPKMQFLVQPKFEVVM